MVCELYLNKTVTKFILIWAEKERLSEKMVKEKPQR